MRIEKHGLLVSANSYAACIKLVRTVIEICSSKLKPLKSVKTKAVDADLVSEIKKAIRRLAGSAFDPILSFPIPSLLKSTSNGTIVLCPEQH